jgi:hypothetical protein
MNGTGRAFGQALDSFPRRADYPPLLTAPSMFEVLRTLNVGDAVPLECYIGDYDVGTIPPWTVVRREGDYRFVLTVIDANALPDEPETAPVATNIIGTPSTVLATSFYRLKEGYGPPGYACSLPQQAWILVRGKMQVRRRKQLVDAMPE